VFRAYVEGAGDAVLSGGRYDSLVGSFGRPAQATGFAIDVDAVAGCLPPVVPTALKTVIHWGDGCLASALAALERSPAGTAELSPCRTLSSTMNLAKEKGAAFVQVLEPEGERMVEL
jgi:ATP phosphoribosyltransferase regulatory subunit